MAMEGADVAQLRSLARKFDSGGRQLTELSTRLSSAIQNAQSWRGPDADRFRNDWQSQQKAKLHSAAQALDAASKALEKNAQQQEQASSGSGGAGGSHGSGGSHHSGGGGLFSGIGHWIKDKWEDVKHDWPKYAIKAGGFLVGLAKTPVSKFLFTKGLVGGIPILGGVISGVVAGATQWWDDRGKGYSTEEEIGRIAVKGICTGVGSGLGQAGGMLIGAAVGGGGGAAAGIETGPGAILSGAAGGGIGATIGGAIGGAAGGWAGGKLGDEINEHFLNDH